MRNGLAKQPAPEVKTLKQAMRWMLIAALLSLLPVSSAAQYGEWDTDMDSMMMGPQQRELDELLFTENGDKRVAPDLDGEDLFRRAELRIMLGADYVEALEDIDSALDLETPLTTPTLCRAYGIQASCFRGLGDYASAAAVAGQAISLIPKQACTSPDMDMNSSESVVKFLFDKMMDHLAAHQWSNAQQIADDFIEDCGIRDPEYYLIRARAQIGMDGDSNAYNSTVNDDYESAETYGQTPLVVFIEHAEYLVSRSESGSINHTKDAIELYRAARSKLDNVDDFPFEWNLRLALLIKVVSTIDPSYPPPGATDWREETELTISKIKAIMAETPASGKLYGYLALCYLEMDDDLQSRSAAFQGCEAALPSVDPTQEATCGLIAHLIGERIYWLSSVPAAESFGTAQFRFACTGWFDPCSGGL